MLKIIFQTASLFLSLFRKKKEDHEEARQAVDEGAREAQAAREAADALERAQKGGEGPPRTTEPGP